MIAGVRRVLLVGFMGSGKSTVGRRVAEELGWRFLDFDDQVVARTGRSIAEIFAEDGEAAFRALEAEEARAALILDGVVLGSGGGWAAVEGRLEDLPEGTLSVWLKVTAEEAVRRTSSHSVGRPLLAGSDPLGVARGLLLQREPRYARADHEVDTTGHSQEDVVRRVTQLVRTESRT